MHSNGLSKSIHLMKTLSDGRCDLCFLGYGILGDCFFALNIKIRLLANLISRQADLRMVRIFCWVLRCLCHFIGDFWRRLHRQMNAFYIAFTLLLLSLTFPVPYTIFLSREILRNQYTYDTLGGMNTQWKKDENQPLYITNNTKSMN